jgi:hypothetical protein
MNKIILVFMLCASSTFAALSNVAFTSKEEMNRHSAQVQKNVMLRNTNPVEGTEQCAYIREYIVKYALNAHEHSSIWYFVDQCYDKDFKQVGNDTYSFNYDGDDTKRFKLPPGCPPPVVEEKKKNPCENGIALGDQLYKDIAEITTKKLTEHPLSSLNGSEKPTAGTTTETKPNGDEVTTSPDGTVKTVRPDGSSTTTHPDGTVEEVSPEKVKTTTRPDKSEHVSRPDNSTTVKLPDGTTYEENPDRSTKVTLPDGTTHEADTKGNVVVTDPSGVVHTTHPDKTVSVENKNPIGTHTVNEDKSTVVSLPDDTKFTEKPDESTLVEEPNGTTHETKPDKTVVVTRPDGSSVVVLPDGNTTLTLKDGTTVSTPAPTTENPNPSPVIKNPSQEVVESVTGSDKPLTTTNENETVELKPDGTTVTTLPDGNTLEQRPDGSSLYTSPEKDTHEFSPNGTLTTKNPEGAVEVVIQPDGTSVENLPNKSTLTTNPDGSSLEKKPDGTTVARKPDGSAEVTRPDKSTVQVSPDGSTVEKKPDGTTVARKPDGSSVETKPDGTVVTTAPDGKTTTTTPSPTPTDPANVTTTVVYADGSVSPSPEKTPEEETIDPNQVPAIVNEKNGMETVVKQIPVLEDKLREVLLNSMKETPTPVTNTVNPDGSRVVTYKYPNGAESTVVELPNGNTTVKTVEKPSGNINEVKYDKESKTLIKTLKDPEGNVISSSTHEQKPEDPNVEIVTYYDKDKVQVGLPEERPAKYDFLNPSTLTNLEVTPELETLFNDAATNFADTLEGYVDDNVKCFLENLYKKRENYLTFVCAHSEQRSIREVLFAKFGENTICDRIKCEALERELIDRMLEASNKGLDMSKIEVVSNSHKTEIVDADATGKEMTKTPTFSPQ